MYRFHAGTLIALLIAVAGAGPSAGAAESRRSSARSASSAPAPTNPQGKIISVQGNVEHTPAAAEVWTPAKVFQSLFERERVRTGAVSRAAILFLDETQVKLNANAVLTVQQVKTPGASVSTTFDLQQGEGWFRTKNPKAGVTVKTPAASAAIRGTEINVAIRANNETVLTVVEGSVEFSNPQGALIVNAGEEASAFPGQAPTKRVILNPEDAVQWALYYPVAIAAHDLPSGADTSGGFARLRAGDAAGALQAFMPAISSSSWARLGASAAYAELGNMAEAAAVLDRGGPEQPSPDLLAQRAAVALSSGNVTAARASLDAALAGDPQALRALVLLSSLELRQNHAERASELAERALTAHRDSVAAHIAAAEAAQARFDLRGAAGHLDAALALDPDDPRARINRARIRFGTGNTRGARADAARAAAVAPNEATVRSLLGFIELSEGHVAAAKADFQAAAAADAEFGEPHLGLGLVDFRDSLVDDGLLEMLTATLLEPKVSLYQSYLGKAYYQAHRFPEGLAALTSAKRLDPRDPTPFLYTSLFLRDQNRQVDALNELRRAIALNDDRAVYRSRLLLDRDLATKNIGLAELYEQLGFAAWGAFEAQNSLEADFTNASAHIFMANTYGDLPDRLQASGGELLQYLLYAPVNRNLFNNFSEYTALLDQPGAQLTVTSETGSRRRSYGDVVSRSGNDRFAHTAFVETAGTNGFRVSRDDRTQAFAQAKVAFGSRDDMFASVTAVRANSGAPENAVVSFGSLDDIAHTVILRRFTDTGDPLETNLSSITDGSLGYRHTWRPGSAFVAAAQYDETTQAFVHPSAISSPCESLALEDTPLRARGRRENPYRTFDVQAQQTTQLGRHQLIVGGHRMDRRKESTCSETFFNAAAGDLFARSSSTRANDDVVAALVRDEIEVSRRLHVTAGVQYANLRYGDEGAPTRPRTVVRRWDPLAGVAIRLSPATMLRAAAFRNVNADFIGSSIAPPTVSGFIVQRNEFPTTRRDEFGVSLEHAWAGVFLGVRGYHRTSDVPALHGSASFLPELENTNVGANAYVNWIVSQRLSVFADQQFSNLQTTTNAYDRHDTVARGGVNFIHPRGIFLRLTATGIRQRFVNTTVPGLPDSTFALVDARAAYELPGKRGTMTLTVNNLLNENFRSVLEGFSLEQFLPRRVVLLTFKVRVY